MSIYIHFLLVLNAKMGEGAPQIASKIVYILNRKGGGGQLPLCHPPPLIISFALAYNTSNFLHSHTAEDAHISIMIFFPNCMQTIRYLSIMDVVTMCSCLYKNYHEHVTLQLFAENVCYQKIIVVFNEIIRISYCK